MNKLMAFRIICAVLIVACYSLISGCRVDFGDELIGKWVNIKYSDSTLLIERNGANFIVRKTEPGRYFNGKIQTVNFLSTLKDGVLITDQMISFTLDGGNGHLTDGHNEYMRVR